jgi:hypothetical protein
MNKIQLKLLIRNLQNLTEIHKLPKQKIKLKEIIESQFNSVKKLFKQVLYLL